MMGITNIVFHNKLFPHEVEMMTFTTKYCVECSSLLQYNNNNEIKNVLC